MKNRFSRLIALAVLYYASGYWLRGGQNANGWDKTLLYSGLGLGVLTSLSAPFQGGLEASIPVAITATLFAAEAFALRNVWWALPANAFYLMSYFMILFELNVEEPTVLLHRRGAAGHADAFSAHTRREQNRRVHRRACFPNWCCWAQPIFKWCPRTSCPSSLCFSCNP